MQNSEDSPLKVKTKGECYGKMHVGICVNIQRGLNKAPWPLCLSSDFNYTPTPSISSLNSLFHQSSVLMHSQEQALKPSKQALNLIFNKKPHDLSTWKISLVLSTKKITWTFF